MAQNLSVPLAFVALLHLANEKVSFSLDVLTVGRARLCMSSVPQNLELVKVDDMSDIIIRQGS